MENENVVNETTNSEVINTSNNMSNDFKEKKKGNKGIIIGIVVVILAIAGYFLYSNLNNPKNLFLKAINNGYKEVENLYDDLLNSKDVKKLDKKALKTTASLDFDIKMDDSLLNSDTKKIIEEINKLDVKAEIGYDRKNKKMSTIIDTKYDDDNLLGANLYFKESNMYLELKDLFDKYIEIPVDNYDSLFEQANTEDLKDLVKITKDSFLNNLNKNEFKKSKEKVKVNKKEIKATKITYSFSQKSATLLVKNVLNDCKDNKEFIKKLSKMTGLKEKEVKTKITELIDKVSSSLEDDELSTEKVLTIATYVKGIKGSLVGVSATIKDSKEEIEMAYLKNGNDKEIKLKQDKKTLATITITGKDNDKKITGDISGAKLTANINSKNNTTTSDFEINYSGVILKGKMESKTKEIKKDTKYDVTSKASISLKAAGVDMASIKINSSGTTEYVDELEIPSIKDKVKYTDLTEEDTNSIKNKLMQNKNLIKFITNLSGTSLY